jgi:hypothetical protein
MEYVDFSIEASRISTPDGGKRLGFHVRVLEEMQPEEAVTITFEVRELQRTLDRLERRELDRDGLISVGRDLAALLLPVDSVAGKSSIREMLARRLLTSGAAGVRMRLRLPRALAGLPWEYLYVERAGGDGMDGFLALDPRIALVRDDVLGPPMAVSALEGELKIVAAFANAAGLPELKLETELQDITAAVANIVGVHLEPIENATLDRVQALLTGAQVFHFAGHGDFTREMGASPGTYNGTGFLAFDDTRVDAEQFGINLRGHQVRLVVLAGCETGRRDRVSVWSGIAPALTKVDIPAVVANQYAITDNAAIAFSRSFYHALAGGLPVERAVSAGRLAIYNQDTEGRDWGVPVLYLRSATGALFAGATDLRARAQARAAVEADVSVRAGHVAAHGIVYGARVREILDGSLSIAVSTGDVSGNVVGVQAERVEGGQLTTNVQVGDVTGGSVIGAEIGSVGRRRVMRSGGPPRTSAAAPASSAPAAPSTTSVTARDVSKGGTVVGTVHGNVTIVSGSESEDPSIEERIRLDVATTTSAVVEEPFIVVVAVKQPGSPPLSELDLDHVQSAAGAIFRASEDEDVRYRVELSGAGFTIEPKHHVFRLKAGKDSPAIGFQVIATKPGKRSLFVNAYQLGRLEPELAAQTRLTIEVKVAVGPS